MTDTYELPCYPVLKTDIFASSYDVFVCFSQFDTPLIPGVFVFTMKWGHAHADLSLFL